MKRAFVRAVWGDFIEKEHSTSPRPDKLSSDISKQTKKEEFDKCPYITYVFGKWNKHFLENSGIDHKKIRLVSNKSNLWDMKTELYRHKLEVLLYAMEDFDEIVYLDWDCLPQKKITSEIWEILHKKESFQANLQLYKTKKCLWRKTDQRKTCNGSFIYIRDKKIPDFLIKNWEKLKKYTISQKEKRQDRNLELRQREKSLIYDDEPSLSMYVDGLMNGWKGMEEYWSSFEPMVCKLNSKSAYSDELLLEKDVYFSHFS